MPRISCACHKNNIAVRFAIAKDKFLPQIIRRLSSYSAKQKNSISRVKLSIQKKARLRIENATRWSSQFLLIESHHNGYKKGIFTDEFPCPVKFEALELYLQILHPAFQFNLIMQRTTSTIADVLPALAIMTSKWSRMIVPSQYKQLCKNLILAFNKKFKYELESPIYCVASLLNVSKLHKWQTRSDCTYIRRTAIDNLVTVAKQFLSKKYPNINSEPVETETDLSQASSEEDSLNGLFEDDTYNDPATIGNEIESVRLDTEKIEFLKIIDSHNFFTDDTSKFWFDNSKKLKFLNDLALVLWNIPSSSAYIERFYSICGNVCKTRAGNMTPTTICQRSFLKANSKVLNKLCLKK